MINSDSQSSVAGAVSFLDEATGLLFDCGALTAVCPSIPTNEAFNETPACSYSGICLLGTMDSTPLYEPPLILHGGVR